MRAATRASVALVIAGAFIGACSGTVAPTAEPTAAPVSAATAVPTAEPTAAPAVVEVSGSTGTCGQDGDDTVCDNVTASDERVAGTARYVTDCPETVDGDTTVAVCSFPITLTNAGGTWEGTVEGTSTWSTAAPAHVHVLDATYLGTGAYEGLRFVQHIEGLDYPMSYTGRIEPVG